MTACPRCRRFYKVRKVGVYFEEGMPRGDDAWQPYKLWAGDLLECEGCGAQALVTSERQGPISEHYKPEYPGLVDRLRPLCRIDDCPGAYRAEKAAALVPGPPEAGAGGPTR